MKIVELPNGYSIIVSNDEYRLIKKVAANKKLSLDSLGEYYQELGEKLYSRGVLNKETEDNIEYFVPIKRSDDNGRL